MSNEHSVAGGVVGFKVGDHVKVVSKVLAEPGWDDVWVDLMSDMIGHTFVVKRVNRQGVHLLKPDPYGSIYGFPPSSLELVHPAEAEQTAPDSIDAPAAPQTTAIERARLEGWNAAIEAAVRRCETAFAFDTDFKSAAQHCANRLRALVQTPKEGARSTANKGHVDCGECPLISTGCEGRCMRAIP